MEQVAGDKVMTESAGAPPPSPGSTVTATPIAAAPRPKSGPLSRAAVATVLQYWRAFDLDSKRVMLDTQGSAMKTEKDNSLRSRKKLAEATKNFRKLPDPDKVAGMGSLLRAYQEEIDSLTRRAKYSENAFFQLYKGLYAAPDPVPSLESITDAAPKTQELTEENKRLKREIREYEIEFSSLKNQEITIRKLEEQLAKRDREMDDVVHDKVAESCKDLEDQLAAKDHELNQQRLDFERQLEHSRSELREAFSRLDSVQSELFAHKQRSGLAKSSLDAEMEMISQEAILMQTLKLENAQLKRQVDELLSVSTSESTPALASVPSGGLSLDLSQKETTIVNLRQEVFRLKEAVSQLENEAAGEKDRYEELLQQAKRVQDDLASQLTARPTMEKFNEVVHQLRILQQLEYNIVDEEDNRTSQGGSSSETDASQASTEIEKILVARVRRLEHSLQQSDLALQKRSAELEQLQADLQQKTTTIREQATLLRTLEETVASLETRCASSSIGGAPTDVGAEILSDAVEEQRKTSSEGVGVGIGSDSKMFEIVRGQRDRFRDRMKEYQAEKNKVEEMANAYRSQVARLEQDNMQLYQKIRYLQNYRTAGSAGRSGNLRVVPGLTPHTSMYDDMEGGASHGGPAAMAEVESRYKSLYEEKMNPFQQFNKLESQQRYTNLNTVDKILLNSARLFLGHRITRNFAFGYILLLHFLVFATLYTFMHGCGITNA